MLTKEEAIKMVAQLGEIKTVLDKAHTQTSGKKDDLEADEDGGQNEDIEELEGNISILEEMQQSLEELLDNANGFTS